VAAFVGRHVEAVGVGLGRNVALADHAEQPRLRQGDERARAVDGVFERIADQAVVGPDDERGEHNTYARAAAAEAEQDNPDGNY